MRHLLLAPAIVAGALSCSSPPPEVAGGAVPLAADARWAYAYASPAADVLGDVAQDEAGNALVSWWDGGLRAVRLEKRDPAGALVWERRFPATGGGEAPLRMSVRALPGGAVELAVLLAIDLSSSIDLGSGRCAGGQRARFDADGLYVEGSLRERPGAAIEVVAANARGDVIVKESDGYWIATLVRADGTRVPLESPAYQGGPAGPLESFVATGALDLYADGGVLAAARDGFVKLGPDGAVLWFAPLGGLDGWPLFVATAPDGAAFAAGYFRAGTATWGTQVVSLRGIDPATAAYVVAMAPDGSPRWAYQLDGASPKALAARADRVFLVTGPDGPGPLTLSALDAATGELLATRSLAPNPVGGGPTYTRIGLAVADAGVLVGGTYSRSFDFGGGVASPASSDGWLLALPP